MMESFFEASFPVLFFDGNSTMEVGNIFIRPSLTYKMFQSAVSEKIGVSPNQITIYYERGGIPLPSPAGKVGGYRRNPVTSKFNFASILQERNCYFFAVFKRSRRDRYRSRNKRNPQNYPIQDRVYSFEGYDSAFGNSNLNFSNANSPYAAFDYVDYTKQRKRLVEIERERFLSSFNLNSNVYSDLDLALRINNRSGQIQGSEMYRDDGVSSTGAAPMCDLCSNPKMEAQTAPFHRCKLDPILKYPFRTQFGPITRPARTVTPSGASLAGEEAGKRWGLWGEQIPSLPLFKF